MSKNKKQDVNLQFTSEMSEEDYFDDCPICQALKNAEEQDKELTETDLKGAFQKAKENGAVVGGELFNEQKN